MKLAALVCLAALSYAPLARAEVVVTSSSEECKEFRVTGTSDAPFVIARVEDVDTSDELFREAHPVVGGVFEHKFKFDKVEKGRELEYRILGATSTSNEDYDGEGFHMVTGPCGGQAPKAQRCANSITKAWANAISVYGADTKKCIASVTKGDSALLECLGFELGDPDDRVTRALVKVSDAFASDTCVENEPEFPFTDPGLVRDVAVAALDEPFTIVFGAVPAIANEDVDPIAARCQAAAAKSLHRLTDTYAEEVAKYMKLGLKRGDDGVRDGAQASFELESAIDENIGDSSKLDRAFDDVEEDIRDACNDGVVAASFDCGGADTVDELWVCIAFATLGSTCDSASQAHTLDLSCL